MWVKADDKLANHGKIRRASTLLRNPDGHAIALGMFHWLLSYCNEYFTDGFISDEIVEGCGICRNPNRVAQVLINCAIRPGGSGLLHKVDGGYLIHNYHDWNPTADEALKFRETKAMAGREGGLKSGQTRKQKAKQTGSKHEADASEADEANVKQTRSSRARDPVPSRPVPSEEAFPPTPFPGEGGFPERGPGRITRAERKRATEFRSRVWGGCRHDPRCPTFDACIEAIVLGWKQDAAPPPQDEVTEADLQLAEVESRGS